VASYLYFTRPEVRLSGLRALEGGALAF
jgi:hypothetical protein